MKKVAIKFIVLCLVVIMSFALISSVSAAWHCCDNRALVLYEDGCYAVQKCINCDKHFSREVWEHEYETTGWIECMPKVFFRITYCVKCFDYEAEFMRW